jgi:hypothetical protein
MSSINLAAQVKVHPSFSEPDAIITYAQPSGCFELLEGGAPRVKLGEGDLYAYINSIDVRTESLNSQFSPSLLPSASLVGTYGSTQTYNIMVRCEYGPDDTAAAGAYNISLPQALDFANKQGIYQGMRSMLLYGVTPGNGEGLLNTVGATAVTLPADSYGNASVSTYDNGEMALWLLQQVNNLVVGMYQTGNQAKGKIVFLGPQRVFMQFLLVNIVQVTSYQRPGAGSATTAEVLKKVAEDAGYSIEWYFDDTLEGKGAGGSDMVILSMPEIDTPSIEGLNTNEFGKVKPHLNAVNLMYTDMAAPMKIPTPIPDGSITQVDRLRASCGWCVRPQGLFLLSLPY